MPQSNWILNVLLITMMFKMSWAQSLKNHLQTEANGVVAKVTCPQLPQPKEALQFIRLQQERCSQRQNETMKQKRFRDQTKSKWVVESLVIQLNESGGIGVRIYRPPLQAIQLLPQPAPITKSCASSFELFVFEDRVWGMERWSFPAPSAQVPSHLLLSHPHYQTEQLIITLGKTLSDEKQWLWEPQGVCPSFLPVTPEVNQTHQTPLKTDTSLATEFLACGEGALAGGNSGLIWRYMLTK